MIDVGNVLCGVSAFEVDFNFVDPAVVFERHPVRVVFEDRRAAVLADVERLVDRVDGTVWSMVVSATSAPSTLST